jgi:hypothetical protein
VAPPGPGQTEANPWTAEDWGCYYNERAGIADGGLPRAEAEARAYACCISQWLLLNPLTSEPDRCLQCNGPETTNDPLMAAGMTNPAHLVWLHRTCVPAWRIGRLAAAAAALAEMGVKGPEGSTP